MLPYLLPQFEKRIGRRELETGMSRGVGLVRFAILGMSDMDLLAARSNVKPVNVSVGLTHERRITARAAYHARLSR